MSSEFMALSPLSIRICLSLTPRSWVRDFIWIHSKPWEIKDLNLKLWNGPGLLCRASEHSCTNHPTGTFSAQTGQNWFKPRPSLQVSQSYSVGITFLSTSDTCQELLQVSVDVTFKNSYSDLLIDRELPCVNRTGLRIVVVLPLPSES